MRRPGSEARAALLHRKRALVLLACAGCCGTQGVAHAQAGRLAVTGTAAVTATDNANASADDKREEVITRLSLGLAYSNQAGVVRGSGSYTLSGLLYANQDQLSTLQHALHALMTAELVPAHGFIDAAASVTQSGISPFGAPPSLDGRPSANTTEVAAVSVAPRWSGQIGGLLSYGIQGAYKVTDAKDSSAGDTTSRSLSASLSPASQGRLGWGLSARHTVSQSKGQDEVESNQANASASWRLNEADLLLRASAGRQFGGLTAQGRGSGPQWSAGFNWTPSPRTTVDATWGHRPVGSTRMVALSHRAALTTIRLSSTRMLSTDNDTVQTPLGSAYQVLDARFAAETDPVRREALVDAELARLGLSRDTPLSASFLLNRASIDERNELSVAYRMVRTSILVGLSHGSSRTLGTAGIRPDEATHVVHDTVTLNLSHRLMPDLDAGFDLGWLRNRGDTASQSSVRRNFGGRLSGHLGERTSWSVLLRRLLSEAALRSYAENSITATLATHF